MSDIELIKRELNRIKLDVEQLNKRIESLKELESVKEMKASAKDLKIGDVPEERIADLISPLANAERVKILKRLLENGRYFTELMNETGLSHSPLYFHLNVLQKSGYVNQEFARGRYLISTLGSEALRTAVRLYRMIEGGK